MASLRQQLKSNMVALISLVLAITSLGYNTWRNETTEENRNVRAAGFEVLKSLGELQLVVDYAHYEKDRERGNPITGWGRVLQIRDLTRVMPGQARQAAEGLFDAWQHNWERIEGEQAAAEAIHAAIGTTREEVLRALEMLD